VLIVGGGASGLLAIHLLRCAADPIHVTILERRPNLGAGIAYATGQPDHLLNVRASNMSIVAIPDIRQQARRLAQHLRPGAER
jgi:uncharacterized NAD(P)/FAD-binding protein YdhS